MKWRVSVLAVVLALVVLPSDAGDQAPKQSTRHIPVVEDLVLLLQARPDLRVALEGAIRTAELKGLPDMDSFLTYLDGFVAFVPTVQEVPNALKLYYIVNQAPGDQLNRDKSFSAWMNKLIKASGQFLDTPSSTSGIPTFAARPNYNIGDYFVEPSFVASELGTAADNPGVGGEPRHCHRENSEKALAYLRQGFRGEVFRSVTATAMVECVRRVACGDTWVQPQLVIATVPENDMVGTRVRDRLTPKEMRVVALIVQGCKNREIAMRLKNTEQVIKNYLRSIFDKTGVSDRLELALFTIHHRVLAHAAAETGDRLEAEEQQTAPTAVA